MKSLKTWALTFAIFSASSVQAQMQCAEILRDSGLLLTTKGFEVERQNDKADLNVKTMRLLQMVAQTRDDSFSYKLTVEKGELLLGERLEGGWSMEYEYFGDRRLSDVSYRLSNISLVKPNGKKVNLVKEATTLDGNGLAKVRFTEEDLQTAELKSNSPFDHLRTLSVPVVIQGELLKSFLVWAPRMEFLKRQDLNEMDSASDLNTLRLKSAYRGVVDYGANIVKKQSFKFILIAAALYVYSNELDRAQEFVASFSDPWEGIEFQTSLTDIKSIIPVLQFGELPLSKATPMVSLSRALKNVTTLVNHEKTIGGKPKVYTLNGIKAKELSPKRLMKSIQDAAENGDNIVVVHMPLSKRVLFLRGDDDDSERMQMMGLSEKSNAKAYEQLKSLLKD